jgi:hypothetical protein
MTNTPCAVTECDKQPFITKPLILCRRHALAVSLNVTDRLHANAIHGHTSDLDIDHATIAPDTAWAQNSHAPVVYFLTNGDRIKIGTSTNITGRVSSLSFRRSNVVLLLEGDHDLENSLHRHFESDRIARTEWFVLSNRITAYIAQRNRTDAMLRQPTLPPEPLWTGGPAPEHVSTWQKPGTAETKILEALHAFAGTYLHKDQISELSGIPGGSTLDNTLSKLIKDSAIHRQPSSQRPGSVIRGMYAHGPRPITPTDETDNGDATA